MIADRYYYSRMKPRERQIYELLHDAVVNGRRSAEIEGSADADSVTEIYFSLVLDNPHLYYLGREISIVRYSGAYEKTLIEPSYTLRREIIRDFNGRIERGVNDLIRRLKLAGVSDLEAVRRLHDYLASEADYDDTALNERKKGRLISAHSVIGVFSKQCAVCDGISKTVKLVLNSLDIPCIVVAGRSAFEEDNGNHAWNIVKIGGKAYHLDMTWDINLSREGHISHEYFLISDQEAARDHEWKRNVPVCDTRYGGSRRGSYI